MELFKLLGTIAIENAEAKKALQETGQEGEKTESKLSKAFGAIGKGAAVAGKAIMTGLAVGAGAMAGLTVKALQLSGDLEQNMGGAEAVFGELGKTIGDMEAPMQRYDAATGKVITEMSNLETVSKEAYKNMGLSQSDYLATANKMGALFKGAGFETQEALDLSSSAMQRAADVASIMGIDTEAAMEAVAGAAKGNFTMMDNLGVAMNDTAIQNYALEKGINKTTAEMTQQEKIGLAMEMFMEKTSYAAGNYAKENETLAGSLGTAKAALTNFLAGSGDVDSLVSSFSGLANVVVRSLGEIVPRLTTGLTDIVNQVAPMLPDLLNQLLPVLVQGAVSLVNGLVAALPGIVSAITSALPMLIEGVATIITGIATALPQMVQTIVAALPQVIQAIVSALPTLIPALIDGIVQSFAAIVAAIPQIVHPIVEALPTIIISIVEALVQNLPVLIEGLIQLIMGIVTALPQIIQALVDALPTVISLIVEALLTNLPAIIMGLIQVVMGIVTALPEILGSLISAIPAALKGVWDGISQVFSGLGDWFSKKFKSAKDAAVNAWSDAKEKFNKAKDKVVDAFTNLKDKVGTKFSEAKEKAQQKWSDAKEKFNKVKDKVVDAFSNLKDKVSPLFSKAKENATQTWSTVKGSFEKIKNGDIVGAFSDLGSLLKGKFSTALDTAKKGFDKVKQIGKDLISGLWNGIDNKFDWLTKKIKSFAKKVTDKLKSFFGIKSPSRVFRDEIGKQLADGVAVGIDANTENAESAAETMGKKVLEAAQKRLDDYKVYNSMTLADEVAFWDKVRVQCEEGTDARIQADKKFLDAKKSLNEEIASADETLQTTLDGIYQRIEERATEIKDSFGLFDIFSVESMDGLDMFASMNSQVQALESYQSEMEELKGKIGNTDLYAEIESMGVNALNSVKALNDMSDYSLQYYLDMYNKRSELAKGIASSELQDETQAETEQAYKDYADRMAGLGVDIVEETAAMKTGAVNNLKAMLDEFTAALQSFSPKMKLPHFTIQGSLDLETGSVPTVSVEWFKKAMNNAMILDKPTIFGYNTANGNYLGAGDAGSEVVAGSTTLMNMIQSAVEQQNSGLTYYLQKIIEMLASFFPEQIDAFRNMKLQLNTGALVGELVVPMDQALGKLSTRKDRGR
jgi:phage-related protein